MNAKQAVAAGQVVALILGSILIGTEFGTNIGFAVLLISWALLPQTRV